MDTSHIVSVVVVRGLDGCCVTADGKKEAVRPVRRYLSTSSSSHCRSQADQRPPFQTFVHEH